MNKNNNALIRREMIRRITGIVSELSRIQARMDKLDLGQAKAPAKEKGSKKAKAKKGTKKVAPRKATQGKKRNPWIGKALPYKGAKVKILEIKGQHAKARFLSAPKRGKGKKGTMVKINRAYLYNMAA